MSVPPQENWAAGIRQDRSVAQSALPEPSLLDAVPPLVRGLVLETHAPPRPGEKSTLTEFADVGLDPRAVYCKVLIESNFPGQRFQRPVLAMVSQAASGVHDGDLWIPKGCSAQRTDGKPADFESDAYGHLDGDHVLMGWLDGGRGEAVILRALPHADFGAGIDDSAPLGFKMQPTKIPGGYGNPIPVSVRKINGVWWGVSDDGNFTVDTSRARYYGPIDTNNPTRGGVDTSGREVASTAQLSAPAGEFQSGDAERGNVLVNLPANASLVIRTASGQEIRLRDENSTLILDVDNVEIGSAATQRAVLAEGLNDWLQDPVNGLSVQTSLGPSGPAVRGIIPGQQSATPVRPPVSGSVLIKD